MSRIVVIGFDSEQDAQEALKSLRALEKQGHISFEDTAVVVHRADGRMEVKGEASGATETGAVIGGLLGGVIAVVFPIAGIAIGAAAGAGIGAAFGTGVDGKFVDDVKAELPPGKSALFLVIRQCPAAQQRNPHRGEIPLVHLMDEELDRPSLELERRGDAPGAERRR